MSIDRVPPQSALLRTVGMPRDGRLAIGTSEGAWTPNLNSAARDSAAQPSVARDSVARDSANQRLTSCTFRETPARDGWKQRFRRAAANASPLVVARRGGVDTRCKYGNVGRGEPVELGGAVDVVKQTKVFWSCLVATPRLVARPQFAALQSVAKPQIEGAYV